MFNEKRRLWLLTKLPRSVIEDPFELFISALALLSGIPLIFGEAEARSIEALLPGWLPIAWGVILTLGSALTMAGVIIAANKGSGRRFHVAKATERIGLLMLGNASIVYAVAIITVLGAPSFVAAAIILGFGLTCALRAFLIKTATILIDSLNRSWLDEVIE